MDQKKFFAELKRRNVYKVAVAYAVAGWALAQGLAQVFPVFDIPNWAVRLSIVAIVIGFPIALVMAWAFELTPQGLKRTEDVDLTRTARPAATRTWIFVIIVAGALSLSLFFIGRYTARSPGRAAGDRLPAKSIAVLPLKNLSGDPAQDYFADGLTDSLTTDIAHIHSLRVISFQSVQQYKGERRKSLPEIARELNVDAVVEGSVQKSADTIVVNAQLVEAPTDKHLWTERYTRDARDMLDVQNEIVLAITKAIKVQLTPQEKTRFTTARPIDPEAQAHYFLGRFHFGKGMEQGLREAIRQYEQAIEKDPTFAAAYSGIASSYSALSSFYMAPREAMPKAEAAARKALSLDPDLAEAHSAVGYADLFYHWNRAEGERELRKAIELNPSYSTAYLNYGILLITQARFDEALQQLHNAQELEPTSAWISYQIEWALFLAGKYREVIAQAEHTLSIEPKMAGSHSQRGLAYLYLGDKQNALADLKKATEMEFNSVNVTNYAYGLAASGQKEQAERLLNEFLAQSKGKYVCAYEIASAYEGMHKRAKALEWLQRGYDEKCDCLVWGSTEPWMGEFRRDPRYKAVLAKTGLLQ